MKPSYIESIDTKDLKISCYEIDKHILIQNKQNKE